MAIDSRNNIADSWSWLVGQDRYERHLIVHMRRRRDDRIVVERSEIGWWLMAGRWWWLDGDGDGCGCLTVPYDEQTNVFRSMNFCIYLAVV